MLLVSSYAENRELKIIKFEKRNLFLNEPSVTIVPKQLSTYMSLSKMKIQAAFFKFFHTTKQYYTNCAVFPFKR